MNWSEVPWAGLIGTAGVVLSTIALVGQRRRDRQAMERQFRQDQLAKEEPRQSPSRSGDWLARRRRRCPLRKTRQGSPSCPCGFGAPPSADTPLDRVAIRYSNATGTCLSKLNGDCNSIHGVTIMTVCEPTHAETSSLPLDKARDQ
jgi:hypothetical protein